MKTTTTFNLRANREILIAHNADKISDFSAPPKCCFGDEGNQLFSFALA